MITIDNERCTGCGLCARVCHERCVTVKDKTVTIDLDLCSTCCQCVAVCPPRALSWDGVAPLRFVRAHLPSPEQVAELLGQRRTVREFKPDRIDRALLEEVVGWGIYAPTHNFEFRAIIVDDKSLIDRIDQAVFRFSLRVSFWIFRNPAIGWLSRFSGAWRKEFIRARPKIAHSLKLGRAHGSQPPAMVFIVGNSSTPLSLESAQYALYNMNLYAMTKDLAGQNLVGTQSIMNRNRALRRDLGLAKGEKIFAVMGLGRPALNFSNRVMGKTMRLSWNGK